MKRVFVLKENPLEIYQKMWQTMQSNPHNFVQSTEEGIERVLKRNYAFFSESTMIDYNVQKSCNLTQIGGLLDSKGYGIATQKGFEAFYFCFQYFAVKHSLCVLVPLGSPYTEEISLKLLEMQEKGIIQQLYNRWWKGSGTCMRDAKKDTSANPLGADNVIGIFVVLLGGLVFALFVSFYEFIYYARRHLKSTNVSDSEFTYYCF